MAVSLIKKETDIQSSPIRKGDEVRTALFGPITALSRCSYSPLRKFWVVADLLVPVSPTSNAGRLMRTWFSTSQVVLTVSTVGTSISGNLLSGS